MQKHTQIYLDYFGYGEQDFIPCEVCGKRACDIHHVTGRGKGKNIIANLMALCRDCHSKAHDNIYKMELLLNIHYSVITKEAYKDILMEDYERMNNES